VLCPVRRPVTALDWILPRVITFALVPRLGPEINSWACLWVSPRPRQRAPCWLTNQRPSLVCRSRLETPRVGSGQKKLRAETLLASPSAISLPRIPACPGTQKKSHRMPVGDIYAILACVYEIQSHILRKWCAKLYMSSSRARGLIECNKEVTC